MIKTISKTDVIRLDYIIWKIVWIWRELDRQYFSENKMGFR